MRRRVPAMTIKDLAAPGLLRCASNDGPGRRQRWLKPVFAPPQFLENFGGRNIWPKSEMLPDLMAVHAQKRVRCELVRKDRRQRGFALASEGIHLVFTRKKRLILWLD